MTDKPAVQEQPISIGAYVALGFALVIFSGVFAKAPGLWNLLDFNTIVGSFGSIVGDGGKAYMFRGNGGTSARDALMYAMSLWPAIIVALGIVSIVDGYGGLRAAEKLITPLFKPFMNIPGICGLAFITSLQTTDGAAAMTRELYDDGHINDYERTLFCQLQYSANGTVTNYFGSGSAFFASMGVAGVPIFIPLVVIFLCKFMGVNLMRLVIHFDQKRNPDLASKE